MAFMFVFSSTLIWAQEEIEDFTESLSQDNSSGTLINAEKPHNPNLELYKDDVYIEFNSGRSKGTSSDGFNLYIRKKEGVQSVMLVETTKDPNGEEDNFAYRALTYNSLNGDEIRYLNGKPLTSQYAQYSLISSTVTTHHKLGECFLIYIPRTVQYGYPWTRNGTVEITKGTFINIRTFTEKYGDYTGEFYDNPFMFDFPEPPKEEPVAVVEEEKEEPTIDEPVVEEPSPKVVLTDDYNPAATKKFNEIAENGKGKLTYSLGPDSLADDLVTIVDEINPKDKVDIVFAIDTTGSMKDDLESLQDEWIPRFREQINDFEDMRIGLLFYRDYGDNYNFKGLPVKLFAFTDDIEKFNKDLHSPVIKGNEGGDVPEAVYEALYASIEYFDWRDDAQKRIILIGDAEPHPKPRGTKKITQAQVILYAKEANIQINCIILPNKKKK